MNYIDRNVKDEYHSPTIGLIICKKDNYFVIEYSSNPNIFRTVYKVQVSIYISFFDIDFIL